MRLCARAGEPVKVSHTLYHAVEFAVAVAEKTNGAFDPTIGRSMEMRGFNREYRTGKSIATHIGEDSDISFRDVRLDSRNRTITLRRPLVLDLGAVAKGLAIDLAAHELHDFENFAIDGGGDLYLKGANSKGEPWRIGIRHPRNQAELFETIQVSGHAVCTSGDYERVAMDDTTGHHILDPHTKQSTRKVASATVIAATAMLADALATAVFVLGPGEGIQLLENLELDGLIVSPELQRFETRGMSGYYTNSAVLSHAERPADHRLNHSVGAGRAH